MTTLELIPESVAACPVCGKPLAFDRGIVVCAESARKAMNPDTRLGELCGYGLVAGDDIHRAFAAAADAAVAWRDSMKEAA
jgi:hypothetical protein